MNKSSFIIFFSIVIIVYSLANYYIYRRAIQAIPKEWGIHTYFTIFFILIAASFFAGRILERYWLSDFTDILVWIGSFWLGAMAYFFLILLFLDLLRLINHFVPFFPQILYADYARTKIIAFAVITSIVTLTITGGYINAMNPAVKELNLNIDKHANHLKSLRIVLASDIHLGTMFTRARFDKTVEKINSLNPDIIIFAGDIVDEDLAPVIRQNLGGALDKLRSKYGTWAITGNHEYIGGAEEAVAYLRKHNINFLRDEHILIDSSFYIVGREDRSRRGFTGSGRKSPAELTESLDRSLPIILLDHQPFELPSAAASGADVQFSGHTHHGQLWPFNFITKAVYEVSWGYKKIGGTHFYVSSGYGTWGPPVRTGNRPEIVVVNLKFN